MNGYILPSQPQLRVFSAMCSNLAAGWFAALLLTTDPRTLLFNLILGIVFIYYSLKAEELLESYDYRSY